MVDSNEQALVELVFQAMTIEQNVDQQQMLILGDGALGQINRGQQLHAASQQTLLGQALARLNRSAAMQTHLFVKILNEGNVFELQAELARQIQEQEATSGGGPYSGWQQVAIAIVSAFNDENVRMSRAQVVSQFVNYSRAIKTTDAGEGDGVTRGQSAPLVVAASEQCLAFMSRFLAQVAQYSPGAAMSDYEAATLSYFDIARKMPYTISDFLLENYPSIAQQLSTPSCALLNQGFQQFFQVLRSGNPQLDMLSGGVDQQQLATATSVGGTQTQLTLPDTLFCQLVESQALVYSQAHVAECLQAITSEAARISFLIQNMEHFLYGTLPGVLAPIRIEAAHDDTAKKYLRDAIKEIANRYISNVADTDAMGALVGEALYPGGNAPLKNAYNSTPLQQRMRDTAAQMQLKVMTANDSSVAPSRLRLGAGTSLYNVQQSRRALGQTSTDQQQTMGATFSRRAQQSLMASLWQAQIGGPQMQNEISQNERYLSEQFRGNPFSLAEQSDQLRGQDVIRLSEFESQVVSQCVAILVACIRVRFQQLTTTTFEQVMFGDLDYLVFANNFLPYVKNAGSSSALINEIAKLNQQLQEYQQVRAQETQKVLTGQVDQNMAALVSSYKSAAEQYVSTIVATLPQVDTRATAGSLVQVCTEGMYMQACRANRQHGEIKRRMQMRGLMFNSITAAQSVPSWQRSTMTPQVQ